MRTILLTTILLSAIVQQEALAQAFLAGDNAIGIGAGVGGSYYRYGNYEGFRPTLSLNYDRGTAIGVGPGVLGIGGFFSYTSRRIYNSDVFWVEDKRYSFVGFGVRGTYHWNSWHKVENWDVYAGVAIGANITTYNDRSTYSSSYYYNQYHRTYTPRNPLRTSVFVGTRYYFTDFFGVFAEVGYDTAFLTGGLQFKF